MKYKECASQTFKCSQMFIVLEGDQYIPNIFNIAGIFQGSHLITFL